MDLYEFLQTVEQFIFTIFSFNVFFSATQYIGSVVGTMNKQHCKVRANGLSWAVFRGVTCGSLFAPV
jgi:hypothetical protein